MTITNWEPRGRPYDCDNDARSWAIHPV
jgi:hypothetical protein